MSSDSSSSELHSGDETDSSFLSLPYFELVNDEDRPPPPPAEDYPIGCEVELRDVEFARRAQETRNWDPMMELLFAVPRRVVRVCRHTGDYTFVTCSTVDGFYRLGYTLYRACLSRPRIDMTSRYVLAQVASHSRVTQVTEERGSETVTESSQTRTRTPKGSRLTAAEAARRGSHSSSVASVLPRHYSHPSLAPGELTPSATTQRTRRTPALRLSVRDLNPTQANSMPPSHSPPSSRRAAGHAANTSPTADWMNRPIDSPWGYAATRRWNGLPGLPSRYRPAAVSGSLPDAVTTPLRSLPTPHPHHPCRHTGTHVSKAEQPHNRNMQTVCV